MYTNYRNWKSVVRVTFGGFLLAILCKLDVAAAQTCDLLGNTACSTFAVFRSFILVAGWRAVSAYLSEDSRLLPHLLQIVAYILPLLRVMANLAK